MCFDQVFTSQYVTSVYGNLNKGSGYEGQGWGSSGGGGPEMVGCGGLGSCGGGGGVEV